MNADVFLSILALDSYNRGYGANLRGLPETSALGLATLVSRASLGVTEQEYATWQAAGFYAITYDVSNVPGFVSGGRVISYRGTNFSADGPSWPDIWDGWTLGAGFPQAAQGGIEH